MIRSLFALSALFLYALSSSAQTTSEISVNDLIHRVAILASDSLEGRRSGEIGADKAAAYIAGEFKRIGLEPLDDARTYLQRFEFSERMMDSTKKEKTKTQNVVGLLRAPNGSEETVIIGGHYDHLGHGGKFALDTVHSIHYGADDNASGTSGVMELAEYFSSRRTSLKRNLLFIGFSGEEEGLHGSIYYTKNPYLPLENTQAMINMDMIGRLKDSILIIEGMGTSPDWRPMFDKLDTSKFAIRFKKDGVGPSDHASFYRKNIPILFFFTGIHKDYHRASDTKDKVNYEGLKDILDLVRASVDAMQSRDSRIAFTVVPEDTTKKASSFRVYVGGVPDYGYDGAGLKISEVTQNSPADKAGLKAEDVILKFGTKEIKDIYAYTAALSAYKPDDIVELVVKRGSDTIMIPLTLGARRADH